MHTLVGVLEYAYKMIEGQVNRRRDTATDSHIHTSTRVSVEFDDSPSPGTASLARCQLPPMVPRGFPTQQQTFLARKGELRKSMELFQPIHWIPSSSWRGPLPDRSFTTLPPPTSFRTFSRRCHGANFFVNCSGRRPSTSPEAPKTLSCSSGTTCTALTSGN